MRQDHELGPRRLKDAADFERTYRFDLSNYVLVGVSGANLYGPRGQAVFHDRRYRSLVAALPITLRLRKHATARDEDKFCSRPTRTHSNSF